MQKQRRMQKPSDDARNRSDVTREKSCPTTKQVRPPMCRLWACEAYQRSPHRREVLPGDKQPQHSLLDAFRHLGERERSTGFGKDGRERRRTFVKRRERTAARKGWRMRGGIKETLRDEETHTVNQSKCIHGWYSKHIYINRHTHTSVNAYLS